MKHFFKTFNRVALGLLFMAAVTPCLCCADVLVKEIGVHAKVDHECCHDKKEEHGDHHEQGACFHPMNKQADCGSFSFNLKPGNGVAIAASEGLRIAVLKRVGEVVVAVFPSVSPPSRSLVLRI